jgi:protein ImuA
MLEELRQRLRALERPPGLEDGPAAVALGMPEVDRALGGGLACGALHEVSALSEAHLPAATGFVAGAVKQSSCPALCRASTSLRPVSKGDVDGRDKPGPDKRKTIVWLAEDMGLAESGALYGPGLLDSGIAPERLLTVDVAHRRDLLWAVEETLRCRSVRLVIGEMRAGAIDTIAVRRLSLAAAESGALAILLRAAPPEDASTAATRWIVGAAPSPHLVMPGRRAAAGPDSITRSAAEYGLRVRTSGASRSDGEEMHFIAHLTRNRHGTLGSWILTWSNGHGFQCAAHAQPLAAAAADRPHRAVA